MAKQNRVKLKYEDELYFPEAFRNGNITEAEMRKEYQRLRRVAEKRLERFKGTRFENSQTYLRNAGKYLPSSQIKDPRELSFKLYDLYKMLTAKSGSISGIRDIEKRTLETAHERGLTFLNKNNLQAFGEFMEESRVRGLSRIYGSERVMELFATAQKKGLDPQSIFKEFQYWMENREALDKTPKIKNPEERTAEEYKKRMENPGKKRKKRR